MRPREPFPAYRPKTCRSLRPGRSALAVAAALLTRWRHPNLRVRLHECPFTRPRNHYQMISRQHTAAARDIDEFQLLRQSGHTVTNYFGLLKFMSANSKTDPRRRGNRWGQSLLDAGDGG